MFADAARKAARTSEHPLWVGFGDGLRECPTVARTAARLQHDRGRPTQPPGRPRFDAQRIARAFAADAGRLRRVAVFWSRACVGTTRVRGGPTHRRGSSGPRRHPLQARPAVTIPAGRDEFRGYAEFVTRRADRRMPRMLVSAVIARPVDEEHSTRVSDPLARTPPIVNASRSCGWTGPARTGRNADSLARADANGHLEQVPRSPSQGDDAPIRPFRRRLLRRSERRDPASDQAVRTV